MSKTITVHIPLRLAIRGGRKTVISGVEHAAAHPRLQNAVIKALAKAFRWRREIENGQYASITELANARHINESYACRLLRLTLLAPEIVTEILYSAQNDDLSMSRLTKPLPVEWSLQLAALKSPNFGRNAPRPSLAPSPRARDVDAVGPDERGLLTLDADRGPSGAGHPVRMSDFTSRQVN